GWVGSEFDPIEETPLGCVSNELVRLASAQTARAAKQHAGVALLVHTRPLLNIADVILCQPPLVRPLFDVIGSYNGHYAFGFFSFLSSSTSQLFTSCMSSSSSGDRRVIFFLASSRLRSRISLSTSGVIPGCRPNRLVVRMRVCSVARMSRTSRSARRLS